MTTHATLLNDRIKKQQAITTASEHAERAIAEIGRKDWPDYLKQPLIDAVRATLQNQIEEIEGK